MKDDFLKNQLPSTFKNISLLKITPDEIKKMYEDYINSTK